MVSRRSSVLISRLFSFPILHHWPVHMTSLSNPLSFRTNTERKTKISKYKMCKWKFQLVFRLILTNQQRMKRAKIAESQRSSVACARWCKKHSNNCAALAETTLGSRKFFYRDDIERTELIYPWEVQELLYKQVTRIDFQSSWLCLFLISLTRLWSAPGTFSKMRSLRRPRIQRKRWERK